MRSRRLVRRRQPVRLCVTFRFPRRWRHQLIRQAPASAPGIPLGPRPIRRRRWSELRKQPRRGPDGWTASGPIRADWTLRRLYFEHLRSALPPERVERLAALLRPARSRQVRRARYGETRPPAAAPQRPRRLEAPGGPARATTPADPRSTRAL